MLFNCFLFISSLITRIYGLTWGNGYYFHPDENNMAGALSQLNFQNFNPHFFAYGQFPLYLGFFSLKILNLANNFSNSIIILRLWSAIFSLLSLFIFYKIYKNKLFLLFLIFSPGLIQIAHFGTTESLLVLIFTLNIYLSLKISKKYKFKYLLFASIISGIGIGTKLSSIVFIIPIIISLLFQKKYFQLIFYGLLAFLFSIISSPYSVINFSDFISSMRYEMSVATGSLSVFYTRQFTGTIPYIFQLTKIFPYVSGFPIFIVSFFSLLFFSKKYLKSKKFLLISIPCLIYFLYFGQTFVKWTRFMSPVFFVFPLLASFVVSKISSKIVKFFLIILAIIPGFLFQGIYFQKDIRLQASEWIDNNLKSNSKILSEGGNVIDLPINTKNNYDVKNFDFYNLDETLLSQDLLKDYLKNSRYIIIPSRRIFKNQMNSLFPSSQKYYQQLFSGELGFKLIKIFNKNIYENAEETFTVFDNPTIRIYEKQ